MPSALTVESVSKCFRIERDRPSTLKDRVIGYLTGRRYSNGDLWALRDVSFSIEQGRCLGIIGHNGAGKSTLLRLLCGLGQPTTGRIHRNGYVSGLLELGSGMHPEMTGRENILTAGILTGYTRRQVLAHQDEIISFAELEEFIDQPVRTYSSGMFLRLAFSTAMHFDPDVLAIDEVLAVGDIRFQQKCIDRLDGFRKSGKTLILVSHNNEQIRSLCDEVLVLEEGQVAAHTDPENAILQYNTLMRQRTERRAAKLTKEGDQVSPPVERGTRLGTQEASIDAVRFYDGKGRPTDSLQSGESLKIEMDYHLTKSLPDLTLILGIYNETNVKCFETVIPSMTDAFGSLSGEGRLSCTLPGLPLLGGRYYIVVGLYPPDWSYIYDYHWQMHLLRMVSQRELSSGVSGVISLEPVWSALSKD
jgi:lipopolysaccharide transport system ATP-binding protein